MKAGKHKNCKVIAAFVGESSAKKTPYFGIEFENEQGETIEHAFYLTEATMERNIQLLRDLGYQRNSLVDMADPKYSIPELFSAPASAIELIVIDENYTNNQGEIKVKQVVQYVNVGSRSGLSKMDKGTAITVFKSSNIDRFLVATPAIKSVANKNSELPNYAPKFDPNEEVPF